MFTPASPLPPPPPAPIFPPTPSALDTAAQRLRPALASAAQVRKALDAFARGGWRVRATDPDVVLDVPPSPTSQAKVGTAAKPYQVRADSCTCKGYYTGRGCYHPVMPLIVAEALTPTTTITGTFPMAQFHALLALAFSAAGAHLTITAESRVGTCTLGVPDVAIGTVTFAHLAIETRAELTITAQIDAIELHANLALVSFEQWSAHYPSARLVIGEGGLLCYALDGDGDVVDLVGANFLTQSDA